MSMLFAEAFKKLRTEKGFSQKELAKELFVTQSTVARWENGSRLPDAEMIFQLAHHLGVDAGMLLSTAAEGSEPPTVIMVEDRELILTGGLAVLKEVMPSATIMGFEWPNDAIEYAKKNWVSLAFLDIELGGESGLDLCHALLDINQSTNVVFLTAFADYALRAWDTGASGFMVKPITPDGVRTQLANLRHPFSPGGPVQ